MANITPIDYRIGEGAMPPQVPSWFVSTIEKISEIVLSRWTLVVASALLAGACFGLVAGLAVGLVAALLAAFIPKKTEEAVPVPGAVNDAPVVPSRQYNIEIFNQTLEMIREGVRIDPDQHRQMLQGAVVVQPIGRRGHAPINPVATQFIVEPITTYAMTRRLVQMGHRPLVLDMANLYERGGGVRNGANAQEETLCRQSDLYPGLERLTYPLPVEGGAYIPGVQFFREDIQYRAVEPFVADVFVSAAYNCNRGHGAGYDRPEADGGDELYAAGTEAKIRTMLRHAIQTGHRSLVLSAFGCGAFENPPAFIAETYKRIFNEEEFRGAFELVAFGIYDPPGSRGTPNHPIFREILLGA